MKETAIQTSKMPTAHRSAIADYVKAERHVLSPGRAKKVKVIAAELGMSDETARRWLRRDHYDEWMEYWPTVEDLFAESARERAANPKPQPVTSPLAGLPDPAELLNGFDPDEDELMNAQRFASYRHHRQGRK